MSQVKTHQPTAFSPSVASGQVDGDMELLKEIIGIFLDDYPKTMALIEAAVNESNATNLEHYAHSLKGAASNFGAATTVEAALNLEMMGRNGDLASAAQLLSQLRQEVSKLERDMVEYRKTL